MFQIRFPRSDIARLTNLFIMFGKLRRVTRHACRQCVCVCDVISNQVEYSQRKQFTASALDWCRSTLVTVGQFAVDQCVAVDLAALSVQHVYTARITTHRQQLLYTNCRPTCTYSTGTGALLVTLASASCAALQPPPQSGPFTRDAQADGGQTDRHTDTLT